MDVQSSISVGLPEYQVNKSFLIVLGVKMDTSSRRNGWRYREFFHLTNLIDLCVHIYVYWDPS